MALADFYPLIKASHVGLVMLTIARTHDPLGFLRIVGL